MDPSEVPPGSIDTLNAILGAVVALVTGIAATILAFFKLGMKTSNGHKGPEVKALPVPEGWSALRQDVADLQKESQAATKLLLDVRRHQKEIFKMLETISRNYPEHERQVSELHSSLLSPEKEVQRLLMVKETQDMRQQVQRVEDGLKQHALDAAVLSRGVSSISSAVETMARKLKELSQ
tara:strand:+ start:298 stop:837 length:540 start_codon:yes stop_codon:yes gene_type:complete